MKRRASKRERERERDRERARRRREGGRERAREKKQQRIDYETKKGRGFSSHKWHPDVESQGVHRAPRCPCIREGPCYEEA